MAVSVRRSSWLNSSHATTGQRAEPTSAWRVEWFSCSRNRMSHSRELAGQILEPVRVEYDGDHGPS